MSQDPQSRLSSRERHRVSPRLPGFDYTKPGSYFVTFCTHNRACFFGEIIDSQLRLNEAGGMVRRWWQELSAKFSGVHIGSFVVMPNHVHGVLTIQAGAVCPSLANAGTSEPEASGNESLTTMMQWFKTMTTNEYIRGVRQLGWPPFDGKIWQRSFYDVVIRDQEEWENVCRYIAHNPSRWVEDEENPLNVQRGTQ